MRLDHLLSKEYKFRKELKLWSARVIALFDFEDAVKKHSSLTTEEKVGGVAQLGEHLPCTQRVRSSILLISTKKWAHSSGG